RRRHDVALAGDVSAPGAERSADVYEIRRILERRRLAHRLRHAFGFVRESRKRDRRIGERSRTSAAGTVNRIEVPPWLSISDESHPDDPGRRGSEQGIGR